METKFSRVEAEGKAETSRGFRFCTELQDEADLGGELITCLKL